MPFSNDGTGKIFPRLALVARRDVGLNRVRSPERRRVGTVRSIRDLIETCTCRQPTHTLIRITNVYSYLAS